MALALYRKYRPSTFAEVVGQEHVTEPLRTALAAGRINHAYLFSGPRGCGKTSSARIMARSLNCVEGPTPDPCGKCDSCRALAPEGTGSIDVTELDAASHGGVDDARELRDKAFYAPAESRYRVFIIDEAHMVTTQGFNALLKIVEEPPEHLIFIFATTEPDKVLPTIRSRTHHYPFRLIPPRAMRELLERNVAAEGIPVEPAVYPLVIRAGGGSARDTQSVLDQLLAGAGPEGVTYQRALSLLGVTDVALIDDMIDGLATEDSAAVFGTVERLAEAGHDPRRFASDLLDRLRDLVLVRSVPDAAARGLVSAPEDELTRMTAQAERVGLGTLTRYAEIVHNGLLEMRGATAPRLLLELLCARMLLPSASDSEAAMLQRLERLERGGVAASAGAPAPERSYQRPSQRAAEGRPAAPGPAAEPGRPAPEAARLAAESARSAGDATRPAPEPGRPAPEAARLAESARSGPTSPTPESGRPVAAPAGTAPANAASADPGPAATETVVAQGESGGVDAAAIRNVWSALLAAIRKTSRSTEAMLTHATVQSVEGSMVVLSHTAEPLARRLSEPRNADFIAAALHEVLGGTWQVRCVHGGSGGGSARPNGAGPRPQPGPTQREAPQQQPRTFQRPTAPAAPPKPQPVTTEPDIPLPPEPDEDEVELLAEESPLPGGLSPIPAAPAIDHDEAAHRLLAEHLGARPLD
ncbi:DNA polymerase III subunit gamma and tau [Amycolatopsis pithecellobii]|uniref:DNA polymerase III subunit gamma/tau n=1 Tax=Amycolatopsis pithecellobii TaxID=664692 RepID=A0A6N7Z7L3_9PSEU|nr:DNA polymerase III subunit gamma and tau [Amycolatopsis pithecellobii]MTD55996.1 DNA polymerase III subunit gamma and tau [Amycolatopsis pithecellobii]